MTDSIKSNCLAVLLIFVIAVPVPNVFCMFSDYDYYIYDDYVDTLTTEDDVTLGGSTRFEFKTPRRQNSKNVDSVKNPLYEYYDASDNDPFGFESFPFDVNSKYSDNEKKNNFINQNSRLRPNPNQRQTYRPHPKPTSRPRPKSTSRPIPAPTPEVKRRPIQRPTLKQTPRPSRRPTVIKPAKPVVHPEFRFPRLPSLKIRDPVANATSFNKFSNFQSDIFKTPSNDEKNVKSKYLPKENRKRDPEYSDFSIRKAIDLRKPLVPYGHLQTFPDAPKLHIKPTNRPNIMDKTTEANFITSFYVKGQSFPYETSTTYATTQKNPIKYHTISREKTPFPISPTTPFPSNANVNDFKIPKIESRERPIGEYVVKAKLKNFVKDPDIREITLRNHKLDKKYDVPTSPSKIVIYPETNQLNVLERPSKYASHFSGKNVRQFYERSKNKGISKKEIDPDTGLPFAINEGFDPKSVVFENDFRPMNTKHNLDSSMSFKVSSSIPHVVLKPENPLPEARFEGLEQTISENKNYIAHSLPQASVEQYDPNHSFEHMYYPPLGLVSTDHSLPLEINNLKRNDDYIIYRAPLPAFKLRPPPPPHGSPYKRFSRKMLLKDEKETDEENNDSLTTNANSKRSNKLEDLKSQDDLSKNDDEDDSTMPVKSYEDEESPKTTIAKKISRSGRTAFSNDGLTTLKLFSQVPPSALLPGKLTAPQQKKINRNDAMKFDYTKSKERILKSSIKASHLTILKDIWDNLTDESIRNVS